MALRPLLAYNGDHYLHNGRMNENAGRVRAVVAELRRRGLWDSCEMLCEAPSADAIVEVLHSAQHLAALRGAFAEVSGWFCAACTLENVEAAAACGACGSPKPGEPQVRTKGEPGEAPGESAPQFVIPQGKTSVYLCARSLEVALENCALCVEAARRVCTTRAAQPAFALVRPPGHHASSESFGSYCLLNTVAVAARALLSGGGGESGVKSGGEGGEKVDGGGAAPLARRVLVIDWDVHHGDGTQAAVIGDPTLRAGCTFVSIHRHDESFWPKSGAVGEGSNEGTTASKGEGSTATDSDRSGRGGGSEDADVCGGGGVNGGVGGEAAVAAAGVEGVAGAAGAEIVNVPLRGEGYSDADYFRVFERIILPLAARLQPDAVIVSAGYDCAAGDLLGRFDVSAPGFNALTRLVLGLAGGTHGTLLVLEGGYDEEIRDTTCIILEYS